MRDTILRVQIDGDGTGYLVRDDAEELAEFKLLDRATPGEFMSWLIETWTRADADEPDEALDEVVRHLIRNHPRALEAEQLARALFIAALTTGEAVQIKPEIAAGVWDTEPGCRATFQQPYLDAASAALNIIAAGA